MNQNNTPGMAYNGNQQGGSAPNPSYNPYSGYSSGYGPGAVTAPVPVPGSVTGLVPATVPVPGSGSYNTANPSGSVNQTNSIDPLNSRVAYSNPPGAPNPYNTMNQTYQPNQLNQPIQGSQSNQPSATNPQGTYVSSNTYNPYSQMNQMAQTSQMSQMNQSVPPIQTQIQTQQMQTQPQVQVQMQYPSYGSVTGQSTQFNQSSAAGPVSGGMRIGGDPSKESGYRQGQSQGQNPNQGGGSGYGRLRYDEDVTIAETPSFISVINARQGRAHVIIRTRKDSKGGLSNNLHDFNSSQHQEFWHIVQDSVYRLNTGCVLCHHFGGWRSADHFHVHVVLDSKSFSDVSSSMSKTGVDSKSVSDLLSKKTAFLKTRYMGYKREELCLIEEAKKKEKLQSMHGGVDGTGASAGAGAGSGDGDGEPRERMAVLQSIHGFRLEYDSVFPRVYFIPERPIVYSKDGKEALQQLNSNRRSCFDAMYSLAMYHEMKDFRSWTKLSGDPLGLNVGRGADNQIFGVLQVYSPDYYYVSPKPEEWLQNFTKAGEEPLSCI